MSGKVLMCLNGSTYCVNISDIASKLECGYTLGPCDMQQESACINTLPPTNEGASCVCSGRLVSVNVRYIGAAYQNVDASAKANSVPLGSYTGLTTGATFTIDATAGGLSNLRNNTYVGVTGSSNGNVEIPTNCCNNPVGQTFFPFQVIGWVDTEGNTCGVVDNGGGGIANVQTAISQAGRESNLKPQATVSNFPNPATTNATFEFTVPNTEVVSLKIVGINGQLIATLAKREAIANQSYSVTYDVSDLQSGIYFVHLTSSEGVLKKKFVVLK